jgi:cation transport regulator
VIREYQTAQKEYRPTSGTCSAYFKKSHAGAIKEYRNPEKRREGKDKSDEKVAYKIAWSAVKRECKKDGERWVQK